mmetsp:Transcript_23226/g.41889  ORF Transcript_23226/g.41889 Transcript_23226/m.41889 type:complete len:213 (+) Transcript_23226:1344-1982(+)
MIVRQITKGNESWNIPLQLYLRSKVAIFNNSPGDFLTWAKGCIRLAGEKFEEFLAAGRLHGLSGIFKGKTKLPFHHGQLRQPFPIAVLFDHLGKCLNIQFFDFIAPTLGRNRDLWIPRADIESGAIDSLPLSFSCKKKSLYLLPRILHHIPDGGDGKLVVLCSAIAQLERIHGNLDRPPISLVNIRMTSRVVQGMEHLILQLVRCANPEKGD